MRATGVRGFFRALANTLDASHSLAEIVFGLVMVIGVTSAPRFDFVDESVQPIDVFWGAFWLVAAWAFIDTAVYLLASMFKLGRRRLAARRAGRAIPPMRLPRGDWMAALAVCLALLATLWPPIVPYLLPLPEDMIVILSNVLSILSLAWVGWFWARWTDYPRWLCSLVVAAFGISAVLVTIALDVA